MDRRWFILRVAPGREESIFQIAPFPVYHPVEVTVKFCRRQRVRRESNAAFYPGYVFGLTEQPTPIHSPLVRGYMKSPEKEYLSLSEAQVQELKDFEKWWNGQLRERAAGPKHDYRPGEEIRFQTGPFRGRRAIIDLLQGDYGLSVTLATRKNPFKIQTEVSQVQRLPVKVYEGGAAA